MPYGMFILKKLSILDTDYFKATGAVDPESKHMEYFICCAPWHISLLHYYRYLAS